MDDPDFDETTAPSDSAALPADSPWNDILRSCEAFEPEDAAWDSVGGFTRAVEALAAVRLAEREQILAERERVRLAEEQERMRVEEELERIRVEEELERLRVEEELERRRLEEARIANERSAAVEAARARLAVAAEAVRAAPGHELAVAKLDDALAGEIRYEDSDAIVAASDRIEASIAEVADLRAELARAAQGSGSADEMESIVRNLRDAGASQASHVAALLSLLDGEAERSDEVASEPSDPAIESATPQSSETDGLLAADRGDDDDDDDDTDLADSPRVDPLPPRGLADATPHVEDDLPAAYHDDGEAPRDLAAASSAPSSSSDAAESIDASQSDAAATYDDTVDTVPAGTPILPVFAADLPAVEATTSSDARRALMAREEAEARYADATAALRSSHAQPALGRELANLWTADNHKRPANRDRLRRVFYEFLESSAPGRATSKSLGTVGSKTIRIDLGELRARTRGERIDEDALARAGEFDALALLSAPSSEGLGATAFAQNLLAFAASDGEKRAIRLFLAPQLPKQWRDEALRKLRTGGVPAAIVDDVDVCRLLAPTDRSQQILAGLLEIVLEQTNASDA